MVQSGPMSAPPSGAGSVVLKLSWGSFKHIQMSAKELQDDSDWSFFYLNSFK